MVRTLLGPDYNEIKSACGTNSTFLQANVGLIPLLHYVHSNFLHTTDSRRKQTDQFRESRSRRSDCSHSRRGSNDGYGGPMYRSHPLSRPNWCEMSRVRMQTNTTATAACRLRFGAKLVGYVFQRKRPNTTNT